MSGDMIDQIMGDSTEEESKVDVEETSVNLNCVKNDPGEEVKFEDNVHVTQYRVTLENIPGVTSPKRNFEEYDDNLLGFLDNDAVMENVIIKLEDIKKEDGNFDYCNNCKGDYKRYCLKCSTLSHILNNSPSLTSPESEISTVPMDILEIREISLEKGVFLLQTLPKNVIFGPFEGVSPTRNANRDGWKISNKRIENAENGNWMKDIACASSICTKNLDIFQMNGNLYFQTNREIMEGEELLVHYDGEEVQTLDNGQECYFMPQKQEDLPEIFACTLCCLGFQLVKCLIEHKSKCPHAQLNTDIKDFELVECHCCKIWLEKQEHQKCHMEYCREKHLRMSYDHPEPVDRNEVKVEIIKHGLNNEAVRGGFKCSQGFFETSNKKNLQIHLDTHKEAFQCDICMMNFTSKGGLKKHFKNKHTGDGCAKNYQYTECSYQTNKKYNCQRHLNGHRGIKPFESGICKMNFFQKQSVMKHIQNEHAENGSATKYQCSECLYQTNKKYDYQSHLNGHHGIKPFECDICKMKFAQKRSLQMHIKNKHNGSVKEYQCSECVYQTNYKRDYKDHLNGHSGIKQFECGTCKMTFAKKGSLKNHIRNKHANNGCAKYYKCSDCSFQTYYKYLFQMHLNMHSGIKPFECSICLMKFTQKANLKTHIKNRHTEIGSAKDYQCSECTYQTNYKRDYQIHLNGHSGIKPFECGICNVKFTNKSSLNCHIKNKHAENGRAKDYQCSECSFETNYKHDYQIHLSGHSGIKPFECGICNMKFTHKARLNRHIKNKHTENGSAKRYHCSECSYKSNDRRDYREHLHQHPNIKPFECGTCNMKFTLKVDLNMHIKKKHTDNGSAKEYQCSECVYRTNYKRDYQLHLNGHSGNKPFECDICKMKFTRKPTLNCHIKNKHSDNGNAKEYQCSECVYRTNYKRDFQIHLNEHSGIIPFECGICKLKFTAKTNLNRHIKKKHTDNGNAKEYQCSECVYQTNDKRDFQIHLNEHSGIKPLECGGCKMKFSTKERLRMHIKNKHTGESAKEYQCSECVYQTNIKRDYQVHLNRHRGIKPFVK